MIFFSVQRGSIDGLVLLQIYSGGVWFPRDQLSRNIVSVKSSSLLLHGIYPWFIC